jgi:long-chain fatty acid transport protein
MRRAIGALAAVALVIAVPASGQVPQMFDEFGVGPRDVAMGNTGAAAADGYAAAYYNPAALARVGGFQLALGYKSVIPDLRMKVLHYDDRRFTKDIPQTNSGMIGVAWNISVPRLIDPKYTDRLTIGFVIAQGDMFKSFTVYHDPDIPYFFRYNDRYYNLMPVYLSLGLRVMDWFSLGAGFTVAPSDATTHSDVDAHVTVDPYGFEANQGTVTRAIGKLEPLVGVLFRIPAFGREFAAIGATWRDEVSSTDGNGSARDYMKVHAGDEVFRVPGEDTLILTLSGWTPMQVVLGAAISPIAGMTLTADAIWKRWSRWINYFEFHPDPRFHDTYHVRAGIEQRFVTGNPILSHATARAGGYYEPSPVPDQNGPSNILDPNKTVLGAGFGLTFRDPKLRIKAPVFLDGAFQAQLMEETIWTNERDGKYGRLRAGGQVYTFDVTIGTAF